MRDPFLKGIRFSFNLRCSQLIHTSQRWCNNDRQHKERHVPPHVGLQYLKQGACFLRRGYSDVCQLKLLRRQPCL